MDARDAGDTESSSFAWQCATAWGELARLGEDFGLDGVHVPVSLAAKALRDSDRGGAAALLLELERLLRESFLYCQYDTDVPVCLSQPGKWPMPWLRALFDWNAPLQAVSYLPEFEPLKRFLEAVVRDLLPQLDAKSFRRLRKYFRIELDALAGREYFGPPFRRFAQDDASAALLGHLETVLLEEDTRPMAPDPPLSTVFVAPDGWEHLIRFTDCLDAGAICACAGSEKALFITGPPGSGIASLLRMAAARLARLRLTGAETAIPVFIPLASGQHVLPARLLPHGVNGPACLFLHCHGPMLPGGLTEALPGLLAGLPPGSRAVVGTCPQSGLHGRELACTGLDPECVKRYFSKLADAQPEIFSWAQLLDDARLARLGLTGQELRSPFFLWLLAALAREKAVPLPALSLGRAGLFLAAADFLAPLARPLHWRTTPQAGPDYFAPKLPAAAGRQMRWQEALHARPASGRPEDGPAGIAEAENAPSVGNAAKRDETGASSVIGLATGNGQSLPGASSGLEFPDLDPVSATFAHPSMRAYALAEGLLHQLLCALTRREWPLGLRLPGIDQLGQDAADFLGGLCQTVAASPRSTEGSASLSGLLEAMLQAGPEYLDCIQTGETTWIDRSALLELIELASRLAALPLPTEESDPEALRAEALTRWLALLFGSVALKTMELKHFVKTYRAQITPQVLARLLRATPQPPRWCLELLTPGDLAGANLVGLDLTGLGRADTCPPGAATSETSATGPAKE